MPMCWGSGGLNHKWVHRDKNNKHEINWTGRERKELRGAGNSNRWTGNLPRGWGTRKEGQGNPEKQGTPKIWRGFLENGELPYAPSLHIVLKPSCEQDFILKTHYINDKKIAKNVTFWGSSKQAVPFVVEWSLTVVTFAARFRGIIHHC